MTNMDTDLLALLESGVPMSLATIVSLSGSAPRTPGTRMAVRGDGSILGTIGGGRLEAQVIQFGLAALKSGTCQLRHFTLTGEDAKDMDMLCGGELDVLVEPLYADAPTVSLLRSMIKWRKDGKKLFLVRLLRGDQREENGLMCERLLAERSPSGMVFHCRNPEPPETLISVLGDIGSEGGPLLFNLDDTRIVVEPLLGQHTVHLFGAGHVAREVALLAHRVGFRVEVCDDRPEFANQERFPRAEAVHVPKNMAAALDGQCIDAHGYVVIVTRGHRHDMDILAQALRTQAGYIGMIGSRRKRDTIYAALRQQGFSQADLDRVHCPIGLDIGAETPAEIALSIVGELVAARARRTRGFAPDHPAAQHHDHSGAASSSMVSLSRRPRK